MFSIISEKELLIIGKKIPAEIVNADSVNSFKILFDKHNKHINYKTKSQIDM